MPADEDDREPLLSEWTDMANRPTPYDDFAASVEIGELAGGIGKLKRRAPRFTRLLIVLATVCICLIVVVFAVDPPWEDASPSELHIVSRAGTHQA